MNDGTATATYTMQPAVIMDERATLEPWEREALTMLREILKRRRNCRALIEFDKDGKPIMGEFHPRQKMLLTGR